MGGARGVLVGDLGGDVVDGLVGVVGEVGAGGCLSVGVTEPGGLVGGSGFLFFLEALFDLATPPLA